MAIDARYAFDLIDEIGNDNAKREFYLTDIVGIANRRGLACRVDRSARRGRARRQHTRRTGRGRGGDAEPAAPPRDAGRRDTGCPGNRVSVRRYEARARCRRRAQCRVRPRRDGRRQRADPLVLAYRGRRDRVGRDRRAVRPAAPRRRARSRRACRQFRRGQGDPARRRRQGQPPVLSRRQRHRRRHQYRRRHDHLQLRRL